MSGSPWDQPWSSRRGGGHPGGGPRPWSGQTPPWVQGIIDLAQGGGGRPGGRGGQHHRGPRVRRGDVRAAILDVLAQEPMNGYQVIQQIAERSGGAWKPSPGSVYPTIQQLEDEGLVEASDGPGKRLLQLSEEGRRYVAEHPDELAHTWRPFDQSADDAPHDLKQVIGQVMGAVWQVMSTGTKAQHAEAAKVLSDTRRRLYGILADGDDDTDDTEEGADTRDSGDAGPEVGEDAP